MLFMSCVGHIFKTLLLFVISESFIVILFQLNLEPSGKLRVIIELNGQMNEGRLLF